MVRSLTLDDEEDLTFVIEETGDEISLGDYDYSIGDDTPTELTFSRIFEYEEDSAYLYMGGVIADEDREYDGYKYSVFTSIDAEYPLMDEVLVRENKPNEWKSLTGVPRTFKNLVNGMGVSKDDNGAFIVKVYNQNEDLVVDCLNPRYGVIDRYVYGSKHILDLCLQKIVVMVGN